MPEAAVWIDDLKVSPVDISVWAAVYKSAVATTDGLIATDTTRPLPMTA